MRPDSNLGLSDLAPFVRYGVAHVGYHPSPPVPHGKGQPVSLELVRGTAVPPGPQEVGVDERTIGEAVPLQRAGQSPGARPAADAPRACCLLHVPLSQVGAGSCRRRMVGLEGLLEVRLGCLESLENRFGPAFVDLRAGRSSFGSFALGIAIPTTAASSFTASMKPSPARPCTNAIPSQNFPQLPQHSNLDDPTRGS